MENFIFCVENFFIDFSFFYLRQGMPILTAPGGAFDTILMLGSDNCHQLMLKKLVWNIDI